MKSSIWVVGDLAHIQMGFYKDWFRISCAHQHIPLLYGFDHFDVKCSTIISIYNYVA